MTTARTYAKANRLLTDKRVKLFGHETNTADAFVQGDHGNYFVAGDDHGWTCTCPAVGTCSHIIATEALVAQTADW